MYKIIILTLSFLIVCVSENTFASSFVNKAYYPQGLATENLNTNIQTLSENMKEYNFKLNEELQKLQSDVNASSNNKNQKTQQFNDSANDNNSAEKEKTKWWCN